MSEWKKVKLGDVCQIIDGDRGKNYPKNHEFSGSGYCLFLNTGNVTKEGFSFANNQFITKEKDELLRKGKIQRGDLILTTRGTVGNIAYYTNHIKYENVRINSGMVILRVNKENVDASFLYQLVRSKESRTYINSFCTGSAQPQLPIKNLSQICFEIPSLSTQHRIATILSRYDSLIENYQKQIKLLEEAAQRLYKEWFIDLHFPGHENTNIVDGLPEGWERKKVDSIYNIKYGKNLSTKLITDTGLYPVYGANGVIGYYDKANCNEQVVLITSRGNGSGDVLKTYHKDAFITNNSFIVTPLEGFEYCKLPFTFQFLTMANFRAVRTGAAQPQLTNQSIHNVDVVLPDKKLIEKFCSATIGMNDTIIKYREQLRLLTEARDRLLPKLMSGEITV